MYNVTEQQADAHRSAEQRTSKTTQNASSTIIRYSPAHNLQQVSV